MRCHVLDRVMHRNATGAPQARRPVACHRGYHARALTIRPLAFREQAGASTHESGDRRTKRYEAEFKMMSGRLGGVVHQAVSAAVLSSRDKEGGRAPAREVHEAQQLHSAAAAAATAAVAAGGSPITGAEEVEAVSPHAAPPPAATPAGMASAFLRCLEAQLQAKKYMNAGDEAGDVLGSFPSATLLYYTGGGLQGVVEEVAAAAGEAHGVAGPAAVRTLRSLAGAVGRAATQPGASEAAWSKSGAVLKCLVGMSEALEGATKSALHAGAAAPAAPGAVGAPAGEGDVYEAAAVAAVAAEEAEILVEVAAVLDGIAGGTRAFKRTAGGPTVSPSAPAHPLLAAVETRLYAAATWQPDSTSEIAASLVDTLAVLLAPSHAGNTTAPGGAAARGSACGALHCLARAQRGLAAALRSHGADPAAASRLLSALAEALTAACITRDAADPQRGPRPLTMFGEAQLLLGLGLMASGEVPLVRTPAAAAAAVAADAAAGDASSDPEVAVSDASLILEVLAAQAEEVAASHRDHIAQVLQDLRDVPRSLGDLSELPYELTSAATATARGSQQRQQQQRQGASGGNAKPGSYYRSGLHDRL